MSAEPTIGQPLATRVYELLSQDIIAGRLAPGTPLVQEQLAARYEVSRTPVRDALSQLTNDGLALQVTGRGYFVNDLSRNDISDVFEVRYSLESLALRKAIGRHTPRHLARLRALVEESRLLSPGDSVGLFKLSAEFHLVLLEPCGNAYLLDVLTGVWDHPIQRRITLTYRQGRQHQDRIVADHESLIRAVREGDLELALQILRACHDPEDARGAPLAPDGEPEG